MDPAFSHPGEPPTAFEERLLHSVQIEQPTNAKDLWLMIAQRIGLAALVSVLDEFGEAKIWVPSRSGLLSDLWLKVREAEIERLLGVPGMSHREISVRLNVSRSIVRRVAHARPVGVPPSCEKTPR